MPLSHASTKLVLDAPAKLNLHLGIYAQLDNRGYHRADSLMVALALADKVTVEEDGTLAEPVVRCSPELAISPQKNTAYRAAVALARRVGRKPAVRIHIFKRVPDQAGLGGSSSDAAVVLRALCEMWGIETCDSIVADAAREVGADVPFFLDPVPTLLDGAGDVVAQKFPPLGERVCVVLVRPAGPGVSTPVAYAAFDEQHEEPADPRALCELLAGKSTALDSCDANPAKPLAARIAALLSNNLDPVACRLLPAVADVRAWLLAQQGVLGGQVSGSGSCVFGLCEDDDVARRVAHNARAHADWWSSATHIV